jgi:hypothetical protein
MSGKVGLYVQDFVQFHFSPIADRMAGLLLRNRIERIERPYAAFRDPEQIA